MPTHRQPQGNGLSDLQDVYCPACVQEGRRSFLGKARIVEGEVYFFCRRCKNFIGVSDTQVLAVPGLGLDKSEKKQ